MFMECAIGLNGMVTSSGRCLFGVRAWAKKWSIVYLGDYIVSNGESSKHRCWEKFSHSKLLACNVVQSELNQNDLIHLNLQITSIYLHGFWKSLKWA
jgi:hypothetical protein